MASGVYKRNGSNNGWIDYNSNNQIRVRNSANNGWEDPQKIGKIYRRNGDNAGWTQIYPAGVSNNNASLSVDSGKMWYKQRSYNSWNSGRARQGYNTSEQGGGEQFGIIQVGSSSLTGSGYITDHGKITYWGTLGQSGNYNSWQVITFRGTTHNDFSSGSNPFNSYDMSGYFTIGWNAGGKDSTIPETAASVTGGGALTWMNGAGGYGANLCMYNGEASGSGGREWSSNYLAITAFNMYIEGYQYQAHVYMLDRPSSAPHMFSMFSGVPKDENYLNIVLPRGYEFESTEQLIQSYENEEIEYKTSDKFIPFNELDYKPVIFSVEDGVVTTSPIYEDYCTVQYLYNEEWIDALNYEPNKYAINKKASAVKLINLKTDEVYYDLILNSK